MNIVGISAFYHDSSCCLLRDGRLVAAASEERFSRRKHDPGTPAEAFAFCLRQAGLSLADLDAVAYYEEPRHKLARQLWAGVPQAPEEGDAAWSRDLAWLDADLAEDTLRRRLGFDAPFLTFPHHLSHAASSYAFSGFDDAAVLTVDGVGEWATTSYGQASGDAIDLFEEVRFPHSLGLLYATVTAYLGFRVNGGEYKVMGLAPYGQPRFIDQICQLVGMGDDGQFALNLRYFDFLTGRRMFSPELCELFGQPARPAESAIEPFHRDVARSLQLVLEEILLEKVAYLHRRVGSQNLCLAGGVALNCVANGRIHREGPFRHLFVQPAAGDAGGCLGAAVLAHQKLTHRSARQSLPHVALGPSFSLHEIGLLLRDTEIEPEDFSDRPQHLADAVAERLAARRTVAWFQGAMEFGPRALGQRSILANPLDPEIRRRLNRDVKKREAFRPFAPCVLADQAHLHFRLSQASPFMLETCTVESPLALPGITHVDGSARPQTVDGAVLPHLAAVLRAFEAQTGCPLLVNTSFNLRGEPIVCTPFDALSCFARSSLDTLVMEGFLIDRQQLPSHWPELLEHWQGADSRRRDISRQLYTFV